MPTAVFLSHTADNSTFKVGSHHYAREFGRSGWRVLHISTPFSVLASRLGFHDDRGALAANSPFEDDVGVVHCVPTRILPTRISHRWTSLAAELKELGFEKADWVLVDQPLLHNSLGSFGPETRICYRPTDRYDSGSYAVGQSQLLGQADAVVATSPEVLRALPLPSRMRSTVIENGVDLSAFALGKRGLHDPATRRGAVYVGALDDRLDWSSVEAMARALGTLGESVEIFGPIPKKRPRLPSNAHLRGPIVYADVPTVLVKARMGLLPFTSTPLNRGRSPMKLFEYLASGLQVVAPEDVVRVPESLAPFVHTFGRAAPVEDAVNRAAQASGQRAPLAALMEHDWSRKARTLIDFLRSV